MIRPGTPVSYLSAQGVKVFGVITAVIGVKGYRVMLPSGQTVLMRPDRLKVER